MLYTFLVSPFHVSNFWLVPQAGHAAAHSCCGWGLQGKRRVSSPPVIINADKNVYGLGQDVLAVLDRACQESIPMLRDDKPADALTVRHGPETDDYNRDFIERDEKRLADLGRRTVEMYVIARIIADLEVGPLLLFLMISVGTRLWFCDQLWAVCCVCDDQCWPAVVCLVISVGCASC